MAWKPEHYDFDTVIIGGGPSSLILSYILHGHIPYYTGHHHDPLLHRNLSSLSSGSLLQITPALYAHFASSLRYSTQALPINTLLDTLIRPNADTELNPQSHVQWRGEPGRAVRHVVLTDADRPGGQWAVSEEGEAGWDIGTLSYGEMLSLPGYGYAEHFERVHGTRAPDFERPTRAQVAEYYATYPKAVGIQDAILTRTHVSRISRSGAGFNIVIKDGHLQQRVVTCCHLVLATGIFTHSLAPPPLLSPLVHLQKDPSTPLLIIGSGFSAADAIISAPPHRKLIHIYRWDPERRPSPLRGCHHTAYPEYAGVYRQMKLAAASKSRTSAASPYVKRKGNSFFKRRDWASVYEGLPNAKVIDVLRDEKSRVVSVEIQLEFGEMIRREVGGLAYVVGRRGSLDYLNPELREEVLGTERSPTVSHPIPTPKGPAPVTNGHTDTNSQPYAVTFPRALRSEEYINGRTLRGKAEVSTEVARDVFITGSLTGDSLVRHAYGGCVFAASRILGVSGPNAEQTTAGKENIPRSNGVRNTGTVTNGVHRGTTTPPSAVNGNTVPPSPSQHQDLHVDRREVIALTNEIEGGG